MVVELAGCAWLCRRMAARWRSHPALLAYLASDALGALLGALWPAASLWYMPVWVVVRTWVVYEIALLGRTAMPNKPWRLAVIAAALCCFAARVTPDLTVVQHIYLARSYYHLALAGAIAAVVWYRWRRPILECARHKACRLGVAAWLLVIAGAGCFVKGGLGYRLFPYTRHTWELVNTAVYSLLLLVICGLVVGMSRAMQAKPRKAPAGAGRALRQVQTEARAA